MEVTFALPYLPIIKDFLPVGVLLIVAYGIIPLAIVYGLWTVKPWAYPIVVALVSVAVFWILLEVATIYQMGFIFFQPLISGLGIMEILLLTRLGVRAYLGVK